MADELDGLLARVDDSALRADLRAHIERIRAKRTFGLVFESHLPERVCLPEHPVRIGVKVAVRDDTGSAAYQVLRVDGGQATIRKVRHPDGSLLSPDNLDEVVDEQVAVEALVVIADFGEPVYPGLRRLGAIDRGGEKPAHVVIKGENHHVLEALQFTHAGKVDCIYIDPPYNTGARDWKYDNNYVDDSDTYRHSKWLAFMERRLHLAKELLNPDNSVLIVTIDEKEYLRLGMLLQQTFPGATMQMVSSTINPKGTGRINEFRRVDEYLYFLWFGRARVAKVDIERTTTSGETVQGLDWQTARRRDLASVRHTRPSQFFPVYVDTMSGMIDDVGEPLSRDTRRDAAPVRPGCVAVFPIRPDGTEMNWSVGQPTFVDRWKRGYARAGRARPDEPQQYIIQYLKSGPIRDIEEGRAIVTGREPDGSVIAVYEDAQAKTPTTQWRAASHSAEHYGTGVVRALLLDRTFPFPKALYAVEDALRIFISERPEAVVVDFFAGSGTTAHAVMRLNKQDGGRRQSISVTNNEVSAKEARALRSQGLRPGDPEWEVLGIFEHITRPRITAAITGLTHEGEPVKGDYKFTDEFPMAEGLDENVEFVELTYLDPDDIELDLAFASIAPLLWLRAGGLGPVLGECFYSAGRRQPFAWTEQYGVLFDVDRWRGFVEKVPETATTAFVVTDSQATFAGVAAELPGHLDVVRLYENYLTTFRINEGYS